MAGIPDLIAVVTEEDTCIAINPDTVAKVAPRTLGGSSILFKDGSSLAVLEDFEELTGIDPEAEIEQAKEAHEAKVKEKLEAAAKAKEEEEA